MFSTNSQPESQARLTDIQALVLVLLACEDRTQLPEDPGRQGPLLPGHTDAVPEADRHQLLLGEDLQLLHVSQLYLGAGFRPEHKFESSEAVEAVFSDSGITILPMKAVHNMD
jgi:hypothetical protein